MKHVAADARACGADLSSFILPYYQARFQRLSNMIASPIRILVLGEPYSGKTSIIRKLLNLNDNEFALPSSAAPVFIRYGEEFTQETYGTDHRSATAHHLNNVARTSKRVVYSTKANGASPPTITSDPIAYTAISLPCEILKQLEIVELRSTSQFMHLPANLRNAVETSDFLVWSTVATQAWRESERRFFLSMSPRMRRRAILVATFGDALKSEQSRRKLISRLETEAGGLFCAFGFSGGGVPGAYETQAENLIYRLVTQRVHDRHHRISRLTALLIANRGRCESVADRS